MNNQELDTYAIAMQSFRQKFESITGVMEISEDHWSNDTIIVCVDKSSYQTTSIPAMFDGIEVWIVDTYAERDAYNNIITNIKESADTIIYDSNLTFFTKRLHALQQVIDNYEAKKVVV